MSDKQIWPNEAVSSSFSANQEHMVDTRTHAHTRVRTHWWHTNQQEHRFSGFSSCVQTQLSEYTQAPEEVGTSHLSFTLIFFLSFIYSSFFSYLHLFALFVCLFSFLTNACYVDAGIVILSQMPWSCLSHRSEHTYIHTHTHITHDTISPQEKPWARTGRKTLENQDTIWHLWSLNDFLLGVGLRPTGKSQKTGRENYIRENVYAAHSAPSLFAPQMSDYSSTLNLWETGGWWREGDSFHH